MKKDKLILDIMIKDKFYCQFTYHYCPIFVIDLVDIENAILKRFPNLKTVDYRIVISQQVVYM